MSEHVRTCYACRTEQECSKVAAIIHNYSVEQLVDAVDEAFEDHSHSSLHRKKYMRNYIREYMRKRRAADPFIGRRRSDL